MVNLINVKTHILERILFKLVMKGLMFWREGNSSHYVREQFLNMMINLT